MRANGRFSLIVAALIGGACVHLVLEACGRVGTPNDASVHDMAQAESAPITPAPFISEWQPYIPSVTGAQSGAAIGNQSSTGKWRRVGDTLELRITTKFSAAPTGDCDNFWIWGLPPGLTINASKLDGIAGIGNAYQRGSGNAKLHTFAVGNAGISAVGTVDCFVNATVPLALDANGTVALNAAVPIAGWAANY